MTNTKQDNSLIQSYEVLPAELEQDDLVADPSFAPIFDGQQLRDENSINNTEKK
jgi:hypothetical protein